MDIRVVFDDRVPVVVLNGRLDGPGGELFDRVVSEIATDGSWWVIDASAVGYLSSIGLRSLVALEKSLRARGGGVVLGAPSTFVRQVLRVSRLDGWLRSAPTVAAAIASARASAAAGPTANHVVAGRTAHVRRLGAPGSVVEWWGADRTDAFGDRAIGATLADLGFAFGTAGIGDLASGGSAVLAPFVGTPAFAGTLMSHGAADFTVGAAAEAVAVQIGTALGLSGAPAFAVDMDHGRPFALESALDDLFAVVSAESGTSADVLGFVALSSRAPDPGSTLTIAVAFDTSAAGPAIDSGRRLQSWAGQVPLGTDRAMAGASVALASHPPLGPDGGLLDAMQACAQPDALTGLSTLDALPTVDRAHIWVFVPHDVKAGSEKLLQIAVEGDSEWRPEWEAIIRRLYADCRSVALTPLHGGYMSTTFRAVAYDREGRRTLPTVVKIGGTALTEREEQANRLYVARFILNNGTTILGGAKEGDWAGLRYNFLGVNGPESRLVWLREHYLTRPTREVVGLFDTLLTRVLKPWYAQPRWEQVWLYRDHTPLRLFPALLDVAERDLGFSPDEPDFACPELATRLPNPFHFLKHEYPRRATQSRLWYTTVCHGDLNMQNVLVDERENIYVIDFSETHPRNAVSDFARIEPIFKFEMIPIGDDDELQRLIDYEVGLTGVTRASEPVPFLYRGTQPQVAHAHGVIELLRRCADTVTLFEQDMVPYWLALLEWTYASVCFVQLSARQKRYAAISAALLVRAVLTADEEPRT